MSVSSEIGFGYLEMIKLNNTALYNFTKSSQEKHCFIHNHRGYLL